MNTPKVSYVDQIFFTRNNLKPIDVIISSIKYINKNKTKIA